MASLRSSKRTSSDGPLARLLGLLRPNLYFILAVFWTISGAWDIHSAITHPGPLSWYRLGWGFVQTFGGVAYALWLSGHMRTQNMWRNRLREVEKSRDWLRETLEKWMDVVDSSLTASGEVDAAHATRAAKEIVRNHMPMLEEDKE
jgi:hypothetical protein